MRASRFPAASLPGLPRVASRAGWAHGRGIQNSHEVQPVLGTDQLLAEIDALAAGLRPAVQVPDVNVFLARSSCSELGATLGGLPGAAAYALFTPTAPCSQPKAADSFARVLVLDWPSPSDERRPFWLELVPSSAQR